MHERETRALAYDEEEREQMWTAQFKQSTVASFAFSLTQQMSVLLQIGKR